VPTPTRNRTIRLFLLATLLSPAGCFSLSRSAPLQQHYVLGAGGPPEHAAPPGGRLVADPGGHLIGLRLPRLADYLATPFIVVRRGTHQVEFSEYHRWGEDLGRAINRVVAGRMASRTPPHHVAAAPWPGGTSPDHVIQVHILRFEGVARQDPGSGEGEAHLLATWEILRPLDGALVARGTTEVREGGWSVGDFDGLVRLLDAGLEILAEDLALGLERALAPRDPSGATPSLLPSLIPWR
jgi:uncharacterized protein